MKKAGVFKIVCLPWLLGLGLAMGCSSALAVTVKLTVERFIAENYPSKEGFCACIKAYAIDDIRGARDSDFECANAKRVETAITVATKKNLAMVKVFVYPGAETCENPALREENKSKRKIKTYDLQRSGETPFGTNDRKHYYVSQDGTVKAVSWNYNPAD